LPIVFETIWRELKISGGARHMAIGPLEAFGWGCVGSLAVEIVLFCRAVRNGAGNAVPSFYRRPAFIVGRTLLVALAGCIAVASGITQPMQGIAVGAGAPQLVLALYRSRSLPDRDIDD
jgi:hypothetical protein